MKTIALIDYGSGNLHSAARALRVAANTAKKTREIRITADPSAIAYADRIVLPGVGHFADCAENLRAQDGLVEALTEAVIDRGVPFFGICVGQQLLATRGLEHGVTKGLGWIEGEVHLIDPADPSIKVPHMGWNDVAILPHARGHDVIEEGEAYFLHSYHFAASNPHDVAAMTDHGEGLVAAVAKDNILGVQFHPEKSQAFGIAMLERFLDWDPL